VLRKVLFAALLFCASVQANEMHDIWRSNFARKGPDACNVLIVQCTGTMYVAENLKTFDRKLCRRLLLYSIGPYAAVRPQLCRSQIHLVGPPLATGVENEGELSGVAALTDALAWDQVSMEDPRYRTIIVSHIEQLIKESEVAGGP
jgi:hypothetical protein